MKPFAKIDMGEVTRLTRAGRLTEAMALLQGAPAPSRDAAAAGSALDMVPPSGPGGAWTAPGASGRTAAPAQAPARTEPAQTETLAGVRGAVGAGASFLERLVGRTGPRAAPSRARPVRAPAALPEGARFEARAFTGPAGSRAYKLYVPGRGAGRPLPLLVMLHGCTQSPDDFAAGTRMNELAEERGFLVAYPAQSASANGSRCWNWFEPADQAREGGEPSLVAGIARAVLAEFGADPRRVYVAGLSAGGAAAATLAVTHPDLFAAAGVHSGLACGAARDVPTAFAAMRGTAVPGSRRPRHAVPVIVFHGDADRTVHASNGDGVVAQAAVGEGLEREVTRGVSAGGVGYTRTTWTDRGGQAMREQWVLHGAGHAWSGGDPSGSYTDPRGPDASREIVRFLLGHAKAS